MFSKIYSASIHGVGIKRICVEVDISNGLPNFDMVGLLNSEVKESRERVRTAIKNVGIVLPPKRITINLSPSDVRKTGNYFDLPIATGVLNALGIIRYEYFEDMLIVGELSLNGQVNPIEGVLTIVYEGKENGFKKFIVPSKNMMEAKVVEGVEIYGVNSLEEVIELFNKGDFTEKASEYGEAFFEESDDDDILDFIDVCGQESVKRAAMVAACGMHHMLLIGPPGSGKSMIASRIPGILPEPDMNECIEITKIHSIAGELNGKSFIRRRPFRAPHHTITERALVGGGNIPRPGELTLAHKGVLFLDELAEFKRDTIDVLRQPLENDKIIISRASGVYEFPASIMLVGATNPCKCGYYPDRSKCSCNEFQVKNYLSRISGPVLDRIDICVNTPLVDIEAISSRNGTMSSLDMKKQIEKGIRMQKERYGGKSIYNSKMPNKDINKYCILSVEARKILDEAFKKFTISGRGYKKILKVARTIADMEEKSIIEPKHIAEALSYRMEF